MNHRPTRFVIAILSAALLAACAGTPKQNGGGTTPPVSEAQPTTDLALQSLKKADQALTRNLISQAGTHLSAATRTLDRLMSETPTDPLIQGIDEALSEIGTNPSRVDIRRLEGMTEDRDIKRTLEDARYALLAGNTDAAFSRLREARIRAEQGSNKLLVEQARNRTSGASEELQRGNIAGAQSLIREAMPLLKDLGRQEQAKSAPSPAG